MSNFDIDVNTNHISSDIAYSNMEYASLDGENKKDWKDTLQNVTQLVQSATGYGANKEGIGYYEQDKQQRGTKVTKLGLDPLVFIVVSVGVLIGTSVAIVMLNRKK